MNTAISALAERFDALPPRVADVKAPPRPPSPSTSLAEPPPPALLASIPPPAASNYAESVISQVNPNEQNLNGFETTSKTDLGFYDLTYDKKMELIPAGEQQELAAAVLNAREDRTGARWRTRGVMVYPIAEAYAGAKRRLDNGSPEARAATDALRRAGEYQYTLGLNGNTPDQQAEAWVFERSNLLDLFRDGLSSAVDFEQLLRKLLNAAKRPSSGNSRIAGYLSSLIDNGTSRIYPPLAADMLIYDLDQSYRTSKYGNDTNDDLWDKQVERSVSDDPVSLASCVVKAFLDKLNSKEYTQDTIFNNSSHAKTINDRYAFCLGNDKGDRARGLRNKQIFMDKWSVCAAELEEGAPSAKYSDISCIRLARRFIRPLEQAYIETQTPSGAAPNRSRAAGAVDRPVSSAPPPPPPSVAAIPITWPALPPSEEPPPAGRTGGGRGGGATTAPASNGKGSGKGGARGGPPAAPPPSSHSAEPPPAGAPVREKVISSARLVDPPADGKGKPPEFTKGPWTLEEWKGSQVDYEALDRLCAYKSRAAVALARPKNAELTEPEMGQPSPVEPSTNNGNSWAIDACKYCYYRPLAPAHIPPGHADHWWYGTGRGDHNPRRCQACKRFLAEGGDRQRQPRYADHMAQCVKADKRLRTAG